MKINYQISKLFSYFLFVNLIFFSGCKQYQDIPKTHTAYVLADFSRYRDAGIFVTPNDYLGKHTPLMSIAVDFEHGKKLNIRQSNVQGKDDLYGAPPPEDSHYLVEYWDEAEISDIMIKECKRIGATGLSNFSVVRGSTGLIVSAIAISIEKE